MTTNIEQSIAFQEEHISETIKTMANQLRRYADALDRIAKRPGSRPGWRASEAWSEIKAMNLNLRVDVLFSTLDALIGLEQERSSRETDE